MAQRPQPIPIPWRQRWREFRVSYLPLLVFLLLVAGIAGMWSRYVHPSEIIGEIEAVRTPVASITAGAVEVLHVGLLQSVTNGQPLALLSVVEPQVLQAELQAIEADLRLLQARLALDGVRDTGSQQRSRLDLMNERINLSLAQIRLRQAEAEFERISRLFDSKLMARGMNLAPNNDAARFDFGYDVALRDRDVLRAEVEQRQTALAELERAVKPQPPAADARDPAEVVVANAIRAQQQRAEQLQKPVILRSPLDGFVSAISHRAGEQVVAGEPLLTISAARADRVIAWVRPPVNLRPRVGEKVFVRSLDVGGRATSGVVIEIGAQMEPMSAALQPPGNSNRMEVGLPILVQLSDPGDFIAGQAVQLEIQRE